MSPSDRERIRAQVGESRQRQGLPSHVQDITVLDRLAGRLLEQRAWAGNDDGATRRHQGRQALSEGPGPTNRGHALLEPIKRLHRTGT